MNTWQPIDTAPLDGTLVDLWADGIRCVNCFFRDGDWYNLPPKRILYPTHWMPIPEPPSTKEDYNQALSDLYDFVCGKSFPYMKGITTYLGRDENQQRLHQALLDLEKQGKVVRHFEHAEYVVWQPNTEEK